MLLKESLLKPHPMTDSCPPDLVLEYNLLKYPMLIVHILVRLLAVQRIPCVHVTKGKDGQLLVDLKVDASPDLHLHRLEGLRKSEVAVDEYAGPFLNLEHRCG